MIHRLAMFLGLTTPISRSRADDEDFVPDFSVSRSRFEQLCYRVEMWLSGRYCVSCEAISIYHFSAGCGRFTSRASQERGVASNIARALDGVQRGIEWARAQKLRWERRNDPMWKAR